MILTALKWLGRLALVLIAGFTVSNCTMLGLNYASLETGNKPAIVPPLAPASLSAWQDEREALKARFEAVMYGPWPEGLASRVVSRRVADAAFLDGRARLEELVIEVGKGAGAQRFAVGLMVPAGVDGPVPLVIGQTFSPNCYVFASLTLTEDGETPCTQTDAPWLVEYIFGEYIALVPFDAYLERGIAYASFHASDMVPDSASRAPPVLAGLGGEDVPAPTGTLMAWAYGYSAVIDALAGDSRFDPARIGVYGHSRHGKSALLAAIWDRRIGAVLSHQSGFGGAASSRSTTGEGLEQMLNGPRVLPGVQPGGYPHWFDPGLSDWLGRLDALPLDQHQLLALVAPTPVFLGNARRDVWSDPNSTFRVAQAASPVYRLYGESGLSAAGMDDYRPGDALAYFLRPGGHATDARDVAAMLAFLDARWGTGGEDTEIAGTSCPGEVC